MMFLRNVKVSHDTLGEGTIIEQTEDKIKVSFTCTEKWFKYPQAFEKGVLYTDEEQAFLYICGEIEERRKNLRKCAEEKELILEQQNIFKPNS